MSIYASNLKKGLYGEINTRKSNAEIIYGYR
ncbi:MAG: hypothetical protein QG593_113 [Patescibacteria group bacterium]|nr:hypothetical protein [Patescibacteria group bacterium]